MSVRYILISGAKADALRREMMKRGDSDDESEDTRLSQACIVFVRARMCEPGARVRAFNVPYRYRRTDQYNFTPTRMYSCNWNSKIDFLAHANEETSQRLGGCMQSRRGLRRRTRPATRLWGPPCLVRVKATVVPPLPRMRTKCARFMTGSKIVRTSRSTTQKPHVRVGL